MTGKITCGKRKDGERDSVRKGRPSGGIKIDEKKDSITHEVPRQRRTRDSPERLDKDLFLVLMMLIQKRRSL